MSTENPIFPYQNLFITARPGAGASTLAASIVKRYLDEGKKCLVFEAATCCGLTYTERLKIINENLDIHKIRPRVIENGNLVVVYDFCFEYEMLLKLCDKYNADVVVYEAPRDLREVEQEVILLAEKLKNAGKAFIFITHLRRVAHPFTRAQGHTPSASQHSGAIPCFDAAAVIYREAYYNEGRGEIEEIRIYERGRRKYHAVPVEFDFQHQRVKRK